MERAEIEAERLRTVAEALRETGRRVTDPRSIPGDTRALRGLPVIGGPMGGAIPGTIPGRSRRLDQWSGR